MQALSLYELNEFIRRITALNFPEPLWVKAEIAQYSFTRGNHYLNLVEKDEKREGSITAEAEAIIWGNQYSRIRAAMDIPLESILQEGMEVLFRVQPEFHERYGHKLMVVEIDSAYTIGRLAIERQKIVAQLEQKNLLERNASLTLPSVIQNIAVLSTDTAAGYQDFVDHITRNRFAYRFNLQLFKMAMQGENTVAEALQNLKRVRRSSRTFDCVVIIRGGGAKLSLKAFDDYELCEAVANFPLPVLSGIGHERDESVLDMVAHTALKTPTAVADFCVAHNFDFENELVFLGRQLQQLVQSRITLASHQLSGMLLETKHLATAHLRRDGQQIDQIKTMLPGLINKKINFTRKELAHQALLSDLLDFDRTLARGYSISTDEAGNVVKKSSQLSKGDTLVTRLKNGTLESKITKS